MYLGGLPNDEARPNRRRSYLTLPHILSISVSLALSFSLSESLSLSLFLSLFPFLSLSLSLSLIFPLSIFLSLSFSPLSPSLPLCLSLLVLFPLSSSLSYSPYVIRKSKFELHFWLCVWSSPLRALQHAAVGCSRLQSVAAETWLGDRRQRL